MISAMGNEETRALLDACILAEKRIALVLDVAKEDSVILNLKFPLLVLQTAIAMTRKGDQNGKEKSKKENF